MSLTVWLPPGLSALLVDSEARSPLVLDRGACQRRAVIIPGVTSPLSSELLRRWRQRERLRTEAERCWSHSQLRVGSIQCMNAEAGRSLSDVKSV